MNPLPPIAYDDIPFPVIVSQYETGLIVEMNSAAKHVFNNIRKGLTIDALFPSLGSLKTKEGFKAVVLEGVSESSPLQWHVQRKSLKHKGSLLNVDFCMSLGTLAAVETGLDVPSNDLPSSRAAIIKDRDLSDAIINSLPGIFYLFNQQGKFLRWNRNFQQVSGYSAEEIATEITPLDLFEESEKKLVAARIHEVFVSGTATVEANFYTKRRERIPHYFSGSAIDFEGEMCLIGMGIDITFRKEAEQEVRSKTKMIDLMLDGITDGMFAIDQNMNIKLANVAFAKSVELAVESVVGKNLLELLPTLRGSSLVEKYQDAMATNTPLFLDDFKATTSDAVFQVNAYPSEAGLLIYYRNITERRQMELALAESKAGYVNMIENLPGFVYRINREFPSRVLFVSKQVESITGYHPQEYFEGKVNYHSAVHSEDLQRVELAINEAVNTRVPYECEYRIVTKQGDEKWIWEKGRGIYDGQEDLKYCEGFVADITHDKTVSLQLEKSESQSRAIIESSSRTNIFLNTEGYIQQFNELAFKAFRKNFGVEIKNDVHMLTILPERYHADFTKNFSLALQGERITVEREIEHHNHQISWVEILYLPVVNNDGVVIGVSFNGTDLTEQKLARAAYRKQNEQMRFAARLAKFGEWQLDLHTNELLWSDEVCRIHDLLPGHTPSLDEAITFYTDECRLLISNAVENCVANGEWYDLTLQIVTKLGKKKWVRTVGLSERVNGRAVKLYGLFQDIDKEKIKERELARLALIAKRTNNLIVITGADRTIQWVNEAFIRLTGYSMEEAIGQSPGALLQGPSTDAGTVRRVSRKLNAGEAVHFEILNYRKDGEKYWLEVDIQPVYNHKNELDYFIAIQSDITQRKQAIDTLRESEQRFRLMADSAPVMIWMASSDKLYYYFNKGWYAFTGRTMSQELAFGWMDSIHLDDVDRVRQIQGEAFDLQKEFKIEYRLLNTYGEYRWIVDHGIPRIMSDGMFVGYIGTCFDIHDRKRAEESLQFTRFTIEHFSDPVLWTDSEGFFIDFNKQAHDILGYTAEEFSELNVSDLAINFTQATWNQHWQDLRANKSMTIGTEHKRKDGSIIEVEINANHLIYKGREYNCAFIHDVTQRRKAEQRLLESEERFRKLISDLQVGVVLQDVNSKIILTNKIAITLLGLPEDQLLGKSSFDSDWDFVHSDCSVFTGEAHPVPTAIRTREPVRGVVMGILRKGEEQRVWLQVDAHPVLNDAQEIVHVICTFMDVTELRAHQQSLQRGLHEKEVLIKEIHHRVKNNLQLISSILYIRMSNMEQSDIRDFLENTRQKIRSISLIHERLLQTGSLHDVDIEDYLNKLLEDLAMSNTRPNLFVQMDIRIEPEMVGLDMAIYFGLIINELVTNAIKHAFSESAHGSIHIHMQKRGTGHELIVGDDGSTLPEHITIGQKGSFGMQLLEIFIKQINGTVTIDRKNGTTFTIITT